MLRFCLLFLLSVALTFSAETVLAGGLYEYHRYATDPQRQQEDDPYYLLHQIHYQLYRRQHHPYPCAHIIVIKTRPHGRVIIKRVVRKKIQ